MSEAAKTIKDECGSLEAREQALADLLLKPMPGENFREQGHFTKDERDTIAEVCRSPPSTMPPAARPAPAGRRAPSPPN